MKKTKLCLFVALLLCSTVALVACSDGGNKGSAPKSLSAEAPAEVVTTELLRTGHSWNGDALPDYPVGRPELVAMKYVIPPGAKLGWHHHVAMNHGVLVQGELTIIGQDGNTTVLREGEVVVEMVDAVHRGENRGTEPVVLYMFYLSQEGMPLSVQHPDVLVE